MDEGSFFADLAKPLFFDVKQIGIALDNYDLADPHRRADEFDDAHTAPKGNQPLYDTSTSTPIVASNIALTDFPDISDEIMSDYKIQKMLGRDPEVPTFSDLDTAVDYVQFIKNTVASLAASEGEFDVQPAK
jgi:hypothetical protein